MVLTVYHYGEVLDRPAQSYQGFLCSHLVLSVAFLTAFGVDSDLAARMRVLI